MLFKTSTSVADIIATYFPAMASVVRRTVCQVLNKRNTALPSCRLKSTEANILKSIHKDVKVTNQTVWDFAWQNLDRWPDKTFTVSNDF